MKTTNLGFPNTYNLLIKTAVEGFWAGKKTASDINKAQQQVITYNAAVQSQLNLQPAFDIDIYDRLLKTAVTFGIVPERFGSAQEANSNLSTYLSIPRGTATAPASSMVKWFNSNYHVVQPEIECDPKLVSSAKIPLLSENQKLALIGPWTLLSYAKNKTASSKEELFEKLAAQYITLINNLPPTTIQLEEPSFLIDGIPRAYQQFISQLTQTTHLHIYFGAVNSFVEDLFELPVAGFGLDFIDGAENLSLLEKFPNDKTLIAGIINGRNVNPATTRTKRILDEISRYISEDHLYISPSCSLQHLPLNAKREEHKFVFAEEKIAELESIKDGTIVYQEESKHPESLPGTIFNRSRKTYWISKTPFPTTTIGSFPQTAAIRKKRSEWKERRINDEEYTAFLKDSIKGCIAKQEQLNLDILVHGEFERADMVQYFAEHLEGFTSINCPVQSYGTRLVRPPIITGDIKRGDAFTVPWIAYAQSLTTKPVKGMLTGPVTLVQWSYPREDISTQAQYYQCAQALAEEVSDLVGAGITHIQIDEPALREALPLDIRHQEHYLTHAVNAFRAAYAHIPDNIIIHSHMCFSDFAEIMPAINTMGVDVLSIEDSKAQGKTASSLAQANFPGSIGLGVYDVHSPRLASLEEIVAIPQLLIKAGFDPRRIWINPDCGLKTRGEEYYLQLERMMQARSTLLKKLKEEEKNDQK